MTSNHEPFLSLVSLISFLPSLSAYLLLFHNVILVPPRHSFTSLRLLEYAFERAGGRSINRQIADHESRG
jgi:hypothetical protein